MSTAGPGVPPPPAAIPGAPPAKNNKTLIYVLAGCGGCLLLSGVATIVLFVVGSLAAKKQVETMGTAMIGISVAAQEGTLATYLANDSERSTRMESVYKELENQAENGELKLADVTRLQTQIDRATKDGKVTGDEADGILDLAEKIAGT